MSKVKKQIVLLGEGVNQHTVYGDFSYIETQNPEENPFNVLFVNDDKTTLNHETPSGKFAEHFTLPLERGRWVQGQQVEYNPFDDKVSRVWD